MIYRLSTGDSVQRYKKSIVIPFEGQRKVLSTSPLNGGYREDLKAVFNNDANPGAGMACELRAPTHEEHMRIIASELDLDSDKTAGIDTAVSMDNVSIKREYFEDLIVSAIVTGGVKINGGRVGDPASFHERKENFEMLNHGTINIILVIDANLPEGTLTRGLVTCTEAKTAALQELMVGSNYSHGLATGSGTDGTILVCNAESKLTLTNAGKHSKLGELIGYTEKKAVKEALFLEMGLCPEYQHIILKRVKRYRVNEEEIWSQYSRSEPAQEMRKDDFINRLLIYDTESKESIFLDNSAAASQGGAGIKAAQTIVDSEVGALLTPRCGENAAEVINKANIKMFKVINDSIKDNVNALKDGELSLLEDIHAGFHNHGGK